MEFRVPKQALSKLVARALPATGEKSPMAILKCLLVRADANGRLTVTGTDLVTTVSTWAACEVAVAGAAAIPGRWLADVVKEMPAGDLTFKIDASIVHAKAGKGSKAKAKGPCVSADDFPQVASEGSAPQLELPSNEFARLLAQSSYAQSTDDTRTHLSATRIESADGIVRAVATDGHRLAIATAQIGSAGAFAESIVGSSVKDIIRLCADFPDSVVALSTSGGLQGSLNISWPDVSMSLRRADQAFPPYQRVVPTSFAHEVQVPRQGMIDAVKRARIAAAGAEKNQALSVRLDLSEGSLKVSAETSARGESSDEIDVAYAGKPWSAGASLEYLLAGLGALADDDLLMCISGPQDPLVFVGAADRDACTAIVMPMRLGAA